MPNTISNVAVTDSEVQAKVRSMSKDNGGRRIGFDRRIFSYSLHIPERRSHGDRRKGDNRRTPDRV